ncbi:MAG: hypothetical protein M1825_002006 [Sarcosagium campestre]|nr:MAG: hypothetical protein M1825_002006 [Sarcosagium campestre]
MTEDYRYFPSAFFNTPSQRGDSRLSHGNVYDETGYYVGADDDEIWMDRQDPSYFPPFTAVSRRDLNSFYPPRKHHHHHHHPHPHNIRDHQRHRCVEEPRAEKPRIWEVRSDLSVDDEGSFRRQDDAQNAEKRRNEDTFIYPGDPIELTIRDNNDDEVLYISRSLHNKHPLLAGKLKAAADTADFADVPFSVFQTVLSWYNGTTHLIPSSSSSSSSSFSSYLPHSVRGRTQSRHCAPRIKQHRSDTTQTQKQTQTRASSVNEDVQTYLLASRLNDDALSEKATERLWSRETVRVGGNDEDPGRAVESVWRLAPLDVRLREWVVAFLMEPGNLQMMRRSESFKRVLRDGGPWLAELI